MHVLRSRTPRSHLPDIPPEATSGHSESSLQEPIFNQILLSENPFWFSLSKEMIVMPSIHSHRRKGIE
jgi:hypothetical protein